MRRAYTGYMYRLSIGPRRETSSASYANVHRLFQIFARTVVPYSLRSKAIGMVTAFETRGKIVRG